ncbi:potassium/proton antiporter [soil metagenome]
MDVAVVLGIEVPSLVADDIVLGVAALLIAGVLAASIAARLRMPSLVLVLGLGMLVADDGLGWITFDDAELAQNLSVLALVVILYEGGLATRVTDLRRVLAPAMMLSTVGVVVTAAVVAGSLMLLTDVSTSTAWILGAVVASTDAAAVFATVRGAPVPRRLTSTLSAESGMNDPVAVLLTVGTVAAVTTTVGVTDWAVFGVRQLGLGLLVGLVVGGIGGLLVGRARLSAPTFHQVLALAVGAASYGVAAFVGGSSFLSAFVAGVLVSELSPQHRRAVRNFHQGLAETAQIGLFFLLGVLVFPSELLGDLWVALVVAVVLLLIARPIAVVASLLWFRFTLRELTFVSWAGLRGAVPIVLATFALTEGNPDGRLVFDVVFFVVVISTIVQGTSLGPMAKLLGLERDPGPAQLTVEITPLGSSDADVAETELDSDHPLVGRTVAESAPPAPLRVVLIGRSGHAFAPGGSTRYEAGDVLVLGVSSGSLELRLVERWLTSVAAAPES